MTDKKPYNKGMTLFKFIAAILSIFKEPKAAGATLAMSSVLAGGGYALTTQVNAKHQQALVKIAENRTQVTKLLVMQEKMLVKLDVIKEGIDETKGQVEKTRDRVWQIGRDIYTLKSKSN